MFNTLKHKPEQGLSSYIFLRVPHLSSCTYYNVHGLNLGLGRIEKCVKYVQVSGPD